MAENRQQIAQELFNKLNIENPKVSISPDLRGTAIEDPKIFESKEFLELLKNNEKNQVLETMKELGNESTGSTAEAWQKHLALTKNAFVAYQNGTWKDPYAPAENPQVPQQQVPQEQAPQQQQPTNEGEQQAQPRKTIVLESREALREGQYRGTLTADQAKQLEKLEKKEAELGAMNGERAPKKAKENQHDKFKDEDVVKYMYEEWFLAGLSWCFNKAEDLVLDTVDIACQKFLERNSYSRPSKAANNNASAKVQAKAAELGEITARKFKDIDKGIEGKRKSYKEVIDELRGISSGTINPKDSKYCNPKEKENDSLFKTIQEDGPDVASKKLDGVEKVIGGNLDMLRATMKTATLLASIEATNDIDAISKMSKEKCEKFLDERAKQIQKEIQDALVVVQEDARLQAHIAYDEQPDPKPDYDEFVRKNINETTNGFLSGITERVSQISQHQDKAIKLGDGKNSEVSKGIKDLHKDLKNIEKYGLKLGKDEKLNALTNSKEVMNAQKGMYAAARDENSGSFVEAGMKMIVAKAQGDLAVRKADVDERKDRLNRVKARLEKANGGKQPIANFNAKQQGGR